MKRKKVETYEYVLTKEEVSMVSDICAMCVNGDIHSLGSNQRYFDSIKRKAQFLYGEIYNKGLLPYPTEKGGAQE